VSSALARRWVDGIILVLAVAAQVDVWLNESQTPRLVTAPAALLWTLPLLARRRYPLAAPVFVFAVVMAESFLPTDVVVSSRVNAFALIAAFCVVGTHPNARDALLGGGAGFVCISAIVLNDVSRADAEAAVTVFLLGAGGWAIGRALAERERVAADLRLRTERLEREQDAAAMAERTRIAGELHDVIAHSVSVMTIQAGAARLLLDEDPERAREPLVAVEETGHQALQEMRRLLGILRGADGTAGRDPQPGMAQLDGLVEQVRRAGLAVEVTREGEPAALTPGVDLAAYRVVQEALTNVLKHAGAARAGVHVRRGKDRLELEVVDDGEGETPPEDGRNGYGLLGMRQRVALYGGEFRAGPRPTGGFRVLASFPVQEDDG